MQELVDGLRQQLRSFLPITRSLNNGLSRRRVKLVKVLIICVTKIAIVFIKHGVEFLTWLVFFEQSDKFDDVGLNVLGPAVHQTEADELNDAASEHWQNNLVLLHLLSGCFPEVRG